MDIKIETDVAALSARLDSLRSDQIPFATVRALTLTAREGRDEVRKGLDALFTIRRNWVSRGIVSVSANKSDWPYPEAAVGTRDAFMARQELGGEKRGRNGRMLALPTTKASARTQVTNPSQWPGGLLKKGGKRRFFVQKIKSGPRAGTLAVMRRTSAERYPLQVLYLLRSKVEVKARWHFRDTLDRVVPVEWPKQFGKAFSQAIATRK